MLQQPYKPSPVSRRWVSEIPTNHHLFPGDGFQKSLQTITCFRRWVSEIPTNHHLFPQDGFQKFLQTITCSPKMGFRTRLSAKPAFSGRRTHPSGKQRLRTATLSTRCCSQTRHHRCHERCSPMTGFPSTPTPQSVDRVNTFGTNPS